MTKQTYEDRSKIDITKVKNIYFMGVAGTGMASVAGLAQEAGYNVTGSDLNVYPPMSTMLEELKIPVMTPYKETNLEEANPDLVVVANCLSRGHVEVEPLLDSEIPYTSFPKLLGDFFLNKRHAVVVTGTHGKTTTTSLVSHMLKELQVDPGYIIGGIPKNFSKSFHLGSGQPFVIEGDEYDTAFFDKESKFLHYHPKTLLFNNLEFDHADIFSSLDDIEKMFKKVISLVPDKKGVVCNWDDENVRRVIDEMGITDDVTKVSCYGKSPNTDLELVDIDVTKATPVNQIWTAAFKSKWWGNFSIDTPLSGRHNIANIAQMLATLGNLIELDVIPNVSIEQIKAALNKFKSVKRRLEHLGEANGIDIFEDFAHHPTAVKMIIDNFKTSFPNRRLVVAFEPKNATSRRNTFESDYSNELAKADVVLLGACPVDTRIPEHERMSTKRIANAIGTSKAYAFDDNESILEWIKENTQSNDIIAFMSSGSFSGVQHKTVGVLKTS